MGVVDAEIKVGEQSTWEIGGGRKRGDAASGRSRKGGNAISKLGRDAASGKRSTEIRIGVYWRKELGF